MTNETDKARAKIAEKQLARLREAGNETDPTIQRVAAILESKMGGKKERKEGTK